ncbi:MULTISPECIES: hypothetical protein [unclassified Microcoleus]|uniref:hypothetical protein n=1 Tax=unclassified Microcoleus TaxID=2642155 RepID=UPI0025D6D0AE|nr:MULTISPECIES: hypothetical protein [unclassified Microcoleus]
MSAIAASQTNLVPACFQRSDSKGTSTSQHPFGGRNMFTSLTETNPASEYQNPGSRSFAFNDSSIIDGGYFVSGIFATLAVILVKSMSDGIQQVISALQKYASILIREIDKVCTIFGGSSDCLEPDDSQLLKWHSSLSDKNGLGSCYADRDSDTLSNGRARDRLFAKESNVIEAVERKTR